MAKPKIRKTTAIVNGTPTRVRARTRRGVIRKAVRKSGNRYLSDGQTFDDRWEVRAPDGRLLDDDDFPRHIGGYVFVNLRAGVGGSLSRAA